MSSRVLAALEVRRAIWRWGSGDLFCLKHLARFLFAGFWRTLNRELIFKPEERRFKLGIGL